MRVLQNSGEHIYQQIHELKKELKELTEALEQIRDDMGIDGAPYKLLKAAKEEKQKELNTYLIKTYEETGGRI